MILLLALSVFALSSAYAGQVAITISGNWRTVTTGPGLATTPFDDGPAFTFTTTITSSTPTFFNSGETQLPTAGGSYTNGGTTVALSSLEQLIFTDPSVWNGQDFGFGVHDVYFVGDFMDLYFNGPQLFSGPTSAPTIGSGSVLGQEAWSGFSARYFNGVGYSEVVLNGDATITLTDVAAPEPSTALLISLSLPPAIGLRRLFGRRKRSI